jgi:hypothetical protein
LKEIKWPEGKRFAFTVFDDADNHIDNGVNNLYAFLKELGIRTTKSVWPSKGAGKPICGGFTCEDDGYLDWIYGLRDAGFEIGYHLATYHSSIREETAAALDKYKSLFGHDPVTMANHAICKDAMYWGSARLTHPGHKIVYRILNFHKDKNFQGHKEYSKYFWGDLCRQRIKYVRNFTYLNINSLHECPFMPYHDPLRKYVNNWFVSTEAPLCSSFNHRISHRHIDKLEEEGGLCIMYTHFGNGYTENGKIDHTFQKRMEYLAKKDCWFAPVSQVLDFLASVNGAHTITDEERNHLERKWLMERLVLGST